MHHKPPSNKFMVGIKVPDTLWSFHMIYSSSYGRKSSICSHAVNSMNWCAQTWPRNMYLLHPHEQLSKPSSPSFRWHNLSSHTKESRSAIYYYILEEGVQIHRYNVDLLTPRHCATSVQVRLFVKTQLHTHPQRSQVIWSYTISNSCKTCMCTQRKFNSNPCWQNS